MTFRSLFLMPGSVHQSHAEIEAKCESCHAEFQRERQSELCLACHDEIQADQERQTGMHGRRSQSTKKCTECHTEHVGRHAEITRWSQETFDHSITEFILEESHLNAQCESCHLEGKRRRDIQGKCVECHQETDPHRGVLGEKCATCHSARSWSAGTLEHDETDFPLRHAHKELSCGKCHVDESYQGAPERCVDCHQDDDMHANRLGSDCSSCHNEQAWDKALFDHNRDSNFSLHGAHRLTGCFRCHKEKPEAPRRTHNCSECHDEHDEHSGILGSACGNCHSEESWSKIGFDHQSDTSFPLHGGHETLQCAACHVTKNSKGELFATAATDKQHASCVDCHNRDGAHNGKLGGNCAACHNTASWVTEIRFDHDISSFPLLGLHAIVGCEVCHLTTEYRDTKPACLACHKADDQHSGSLGTECHSCHSPNGWIFWRFDHDTQTEFPLKGGHQEVACDQCHERNSQSLKTESECAVCHLSDDVHNGEFGRNCDRCHAVTDFKQLKPDFSQ